MNFRSVADMSQTVRENLTRFPTEIDAVVGVPRSGMLPATLISLYLNVALTDLDGLFEGRAYPPGGQRAKAGVKPPSEWRTVLIVDDSIQSGETMESVRAKLAESFPWRAITCAVYGLEESKPQVDLLLEVCPKPRMFEWNLMHHPFLRRTCLDMDGVICVDPSEAQNDDGPEYLKFLRDADPLAPPTLPVRAIVSSRLEKYRAETEDWLHRHNIKYQELILLDLPTAAERQRRKCHAEFKANAYSTLSDSEFFIESHPGQAEEIAQRTGKSVLCIETMQYYPRGAVEKVRRKVINKRRRILARLGLSS